MRGRVPVMPMDNKWRSRGVLHRRMNIVSNCIARSASATPRPTGDAALPSHPPTPPAAATGAGAGRRARGSSTPSAVRGGGSRGGFRERRRRWRQEWAEWAAQARGVRVDHAPVLLGCIRAPCS